MRLRMNRYCDQSRSIGSRNITITRGRSRVARIASTMGLPPWKY